MAFHSSTIFQLPMERVVLSKFTPILNTFRPSALKGIVEAYAKDIITQSSMIEVNG